MNYICQMNAFWRWRREHELPASAQLLWYTLTAEQNHRRWTEEFELSVTTVRALMGGVSVNTFRRARDILVQCGLLEVKMAAYTNARVLTPTQQDIAQRLTTTLMAQLSDAAMTVSTLIGEVMLGTRRDDAASRIALKYTARIKATGEGIRKVLPEFVREMTQNGVTAFIDRAGRKWALHTYADMVTRTTSRQADVLAVLTADPEQDLYAISSHGTTCAICAPLEGRVYSRSGADPVYPPLAAAFGKVDRAGGDDLSNTWLNIHPNCLHQLLPWTPAGRTPEEIEEIKRKSSFETNPPTVDPRTKAQVEAYRNKERARAKWLADYRQWERYRVALGDKAPKTFATFQKHKIADDNKYKDWMKQYRDINRGD